MQFWLSRSKTFGVAACLLVGCTTAREQLTVPAGPIPETSRSLAVLPTPPAPSPATEEPKAPSEKVKQASYKQGDDDSAMKGEAAPPPAEVSTGPTDELTLEFFEQLAIQNNPAIQQATAVAGKAAGIWRQVGLPANPRLGYFGDELGNENSGGLQGIFAQQTFVTGDKLAWNQQVIGHDAQAVLWQVEAQRFRVRTDVQTRFYEALAAQTRVELAREFRESAQMGLEVAQQRLEAKAGAKPDVLQSEIQVAEVDLLIQRAEFEFDAAFNELAAVAGVPEMVPARLAGELIAPGGRHNLESAFVRIVEESPLVKSARSRVQRARANLQRQAAQPIPNVLAQAGAGHDTFTGDEFANVQVSIPLPIHNRNQGNVQAAYAEFCEATHNVQRITLQLRRRLALVMREYQLARATVEQYESVILPKATETMELFQQAQEAGVFDFLRVLTARRAFFDANLEYLTALTNLAQSDAEIEGLLLTGGLSNVVTYDARDDLRGQALNGR